MARMRYPLPIRIHHLSLTESLVMSSLLFRVFALLIVAGFPSVAGAELKIPAYTGYSVPADARVRVSESGISRWTTNSTRFRWFGQFKATGELNIQLVVRKTDADAARLRVTVGSESREAVADGATGEVVTIDFAEFEIAKPGYHAIQLESLDSVPKCDVQTLLLDGASTKDAHFNLKQRRNAASVHLFYPLPEKDLEVDAFYCEMTGVEDPLWTYYMACGWHRGYFGMQVNSPTERRIIFSVWDSGGEPIDRNKVADENRVTLIGKGEDVYSGSFGNEGTGGHSHLKFPWKTGEKQRFLVTAKPVDKTHTVFSGYYFRNDLEDWMLISSWKAPKEGKYLRGLYSFSENFVGRGGHQVRKALYGNQWIRTSDGRWTELTKAKFSHDGTGKSDRLDRWGGLEGSQFFLSHGGFAEGYTPYGETFDRSPSQGPPKDLPLP